MRILILIAAMTLTGCGQSPEEARKAASQCRAGGGTPRMYVGGDWRLTQPDGERNQRVKCFATYSK